MRVIMDATFAAAAADDDDDDPDDDDCGAAAFPTLLCQLRITCNPLTASVATGILASSLKLARATDVSNRLTEL